MYYEKERWSCLEFSSSHRLAIQILEWFSSESLVGKWKMVGGESVTKLLSLLLFLLLCFVGLFVCTHPCTDRSVQVIWPSSYLYLFVCDVVWRQNLEHLSIMNEDEDLAPTNIAKRETGTNYKRWMNCFKFQKQHWHSFRNRKRKWRLRYLESVTLPMSSATMLSPMKSLDI